MNWPTISVIVLNYNGKQHLEDCFASLLATDYPVEQCELILMDNASSDGSVEFVRERFPAVRVIQAASNLGFCMGNNHAAGQARGEYVVFLNNDMRVAADWLRELVEPCLRQPGVDGTASKILNWEGNRIDFADAAMNFMGWGCQPGYDSPYVDEFRKSKELLFACGGAMLVRRQAFLDVGGFDPDYFAYYEDMDLGWRLWLAGFKIVFAPRAAVYHRHHGYWGVISNAKKLVLYERNALYSLIKNYEGANLVHILPAALLLVMQRAYLDVRPDPSVFGLAPFTPGGSVFGPRYYLDQVWQLVQKWAFGELARRAADEIERRLRSRQASAPRPAEPGARPVDGYFTVPTLMLTRLLAGRDVLRALPSLMSRRQEIQATRQRTDRDLFPLFQGALVSNWNDDQFIHAMQYAIARFGLLDVFELQQGPIPPNSHLIEQSLDASQVLLEMMDRAFSLGGVSEEYFRFDGPPVGETSRVPVECVAVLARADRLLWSLPDAPFGDVLRYLADGSRQTLASTHE